MALLLRGGAAGGLACGCGVQSGGAIYVWGEVAITSSYFATSNSAGSGVSEPAGRNARG